MASLHPVPPILLLCACMSTLAAFMMVLLHRSSPQVPGFRGLALAIALQSLNYLSYVLVGFHVGFPANLEWVVRMLAVTALMLGSLLEASAIARFTGQANRWQHLPWVTVPWFLVGGFVGMVWEPVLSRALILGVGLVLLAGLRMRWFLIASLPQAGPGPQRWCGLMAGFQGLVILVRTGLALLAPMGAFILDPGLLNLFYLPLVLTLQVFGWFGVALMQAQFLQFQLADQARHDFLTGLLNRRAMLPELARVLSRSQEADQPTCLLSLDVDHFKGVNDTHGHAVGDEVLRLLAATLDRTLRSTDLAARMGGEEFLVLLPRTGKEEAMGVAERIRLACAAARLETPAGPLGFTVSQGLVCSLEHPEFTPETFLTASDERMYQAKHEGRNRVVAD